MSLRPRSLFFWLTLFLIPVLPSAIQAEDQTGDRPFQSFRTVNLDDPHPQFAEIQSRIQSVSNFRAEFTEKKDLNALSRTIENTGFVIFARDRGLFRFVENPFKSRQLITRDGLVIEKTPDETRRRKLKPGSAPRQFLDALYMVFSGTFSTFKDRFRVELKMNKTNQENSKNQSVWTLRLHPANTTMKKLFSRMTINGRGKHLKSFRLEKDNGDVTRTTFKNPSYPDELSEEQIDHFRSMREK